MAEAKKQTKQKSSVDRRTYLSREIKPSDRVLIKTKRGRLFEGTVTDLDWKNHICIENVIDKEVPGYGDVAQSMPYMIAHESIESIEAA